MKHERPLKILHVVGAMNRAGTETMLMNIYRHINHENVQFDFISYGNGDAHYDQEINELGGRIIRLNKTNSIRAIYRVIRQYGPYDAVHAHTLFHCGLAVAAAYLAGVQTRIAHAHTTWDDTRTVKRKIYTKVMRLLISRFSTHYLACSEQAGRYLFGWRGTKKTGYAHFPNAIDYDGFLSKPATAVKTFKREAGLENNLVMGHIGRFIEAKNHAFLLEVLTHAVRKQPSVRLLLVGDGDLREEMEAKAEANGLRDYVRFVGVREDIATMLHSMDVFVFPSVYEGLGLVLLEAQASGVPSVVSEAIQPEADLNIGLVLRLTLEDGPEVWADKVIELANRKEHNTKTITAGFEDNGYSLAKAVPALMNLYNFSSRRSV